MNYPILFPDLFGSNTLSTPIILINTQMRISLALYCSLIMFLLFFSLPSPVSSENQESTAQTTTTSWRRSLAQHGDSLRVFIRRRGGGGGGRGRSSRRPVPTGGGGGSSATTRPSLSITFGLGSTVASLMLLMFFPF